MPTVNKNIDFNFLAALGVCPLKCDLTYGARLAD